MGQTSSAMPPMTMPGKEPGECARRGPENRPTRARVQLAVPTATGQRDVFEAAAEGLGKVSGDVDRREAFTFVKYGNSIAVKVAGDGHLELAG